MRIKSPFSKSRGLQFKNEIKAAHYLSNISYYRLRAYTYPFQDNTDPDHPFVTAISFEDIIGLYVFDRKLRLLVFDAIEKIEIALRTKIIYEFALTRGSHWYEDQNLYRNPTTFNKDINKLYEEIERSTETFITHYKSKYTNPTNPACWMSLEVVSMGLLSKLFENLKRGPEKKAVTAAFGLRRDTVLESWMHALAHLRNICAHHGRLWNRRLTTIPALPTNPTNKFLNDISYFSSHKIYGILCCITYILNIISRGHTFNTKLRSLLYSCPRVRLKDMGFPKNWETEDLWK